MRLRFLNHSDDDSSSLEADGIGHSIDFGDVELVREPRKTPERVEAALYRHDAPRDLVEKVLAGRGSQDAAKFLAAGLKRAIRFQPLHRDNNARLMLIGPPGAGKSTVVAKLASREGLRPPTVITTDVDRPGGVEQLAEFLAVLGVELGRLVRIHDPLADLIVPGAPILVDTAGTNAGDTAGLTALGELAKRLDLEPILVLPAVFDAIEARDFAEAAKSIGARRIIATRVDIARRLGAILAAADAGLALAGCSVTPHFAFGLRPLSASLLARHILSLAP
jgi:flagellar biosynthesis protein FlhF